MNPVSPYLNRFDGELLSSEDFLDEQNKPSDRWLTSANPVPHFLMTSTTLVRVSEPTEADMRGTRIMILDS
jgi:hypothetical protein